MKNSRKGYLMLMSFVLTWVTWLVTYYVSYLILQQVSFNIGDPKLRSMYSVFFLDISAGHSGMFASWPTTFFGLILFVCIGLLYRKFYYQPRVKR